MLFVMKERGKLLTTSVVGFVNRKKKKANEKSTKG